MLIDSTQNKFYNKINPTLNIDKKPKSQCYVAANVLQLFINTQPGGTVNNSDH